MTANVAAEAWDWDKGVSVHAVAFPGDVAVEFQRRRRKGFSPAGGLVRKALTTAGITWSPSIVSFGSAQMNGWRLPPTTNLPAMQMKIHPQAHSWIRKLHWICLCLMQPYRSMRRGAAAPAQNSDNRAARSRM